MEKKILITGAAGFIGSYVTEYIVKTYSEYKVIGIDKLSYCSNLNNIKALEESDNFKFLRVDITDIEAMDYIFHSENIDTVLHFAAYTHVDHSFANSILFTKNNVLGTHVMLELAKKYNVDRFIHVSTDEVYGGMNELSTEETILAPTNPYAATKAAAEHLVMAYHLSFGLNVIITRGNNVYGPRQYPEKVIPKFILHLIRCEDCPIQGTGEQKRSFLYVDDVVSAFDIILHRGKIGEIYNIGSEREYSILEVFDILALLCSIYEIDHHHRKVHVKDRDFNDHRYFISTEKLSKLGWKQRTPFEEGLEKTVNWYAENSNYFKDVCPCEK